MNSSTSACEGVSGRAAAALSAPAWSNAYSGSNEPMVSAPRARRRRRSTPASSAASSSCSRSAASAFMVASGTSRGGSGRPATRWAPGSAATAALGSASGMAAASAPAASSPPASTAAGPITVSAKP